MSITNSKLPAYFKLEGGFKGVFTSILSISPKMTILGHSPIILPGKSIGSEPWKLLLVIYLSISHPNNEGPFKGTLDSNHYWEI